MKQILIGLAAVLTLSSLCRQDSSEKVELIAFAGLPESDEQEVRILYNTAFITGYSEAYKNPLWTAYRLGNMQGDYDEKKTLKWERTQGFKVDSRTDAAVSHDDYTGSGYDRGHMAPNSAIMVQYGQMAQMETYYMSNICPQTPTLNRGIWQKLEEMERKVISQDDTKNKEVHDVYVLVGPVFGKEEPDTLKSGVAIPTGFYRILVYQRGYQATPKAVAFYFPQHPESAELLDYITTVDAIEDSTGFDFYHELTEAKQRNLESKKRNFLLEEIN